MAELAGLAGCRRGLVAKAPQEVHRPGANRHREQKRRDISRRVGRPARKTSSLMTSMPSWGNMYEAGIVPIARDLVLAESARIVPPAGFELVLGQGRPLANGTDGVLPRLEEG